MKLTNTVRILLLALSPLLFASFTSAQALTAKEIVD
jgi:hypothetical protein